MSLTSFITTLPVNIFNSNLLKLTRYRLSLPLTTPFFILPAMMGASRLLMVKTSTTRTDVTTAKEIMPDFRRRGVQNMPATFSFPQQPHSRFFSNNKGWLLFQVKAFMDIHVGRKNG
jgi:hypothetical protein